MPTNVLAMQHENEHKGVMSNKLPKNKQGQTLGRKGHATRERLLKAAERLLQEQSPLDLTAVAIAKEAESSSATFYMYFTDVKDALFTLSQIASNEVVATLEALGDYPKHLSFEQAATLIFDAFNEVWNRHRHILTYRNLEADRGDDNFEKLRMEEYIREVSVIGKWIRQAGEGDNPPTTGDAFSLATVLHAGMERLAALDPQIITNGMGKERLRAAQTRVIAQVLADTPAWGLLPLASKQKKRS